MRRVWLGLAALTVVVLILSLRWLGSLVDSKEVQQILTTRLSEATGLDVALADSVEFSWLPAPGLEVKGLSLTNEMVDPKTPLVEVKNLRLRLGVIDSLIAWQLMLESLTVDGVKVSLLRNRQGQGNWDGAQKPGPTSPTPDSDDPDADSLVSRVREVSVSGLSIRYQDETSGSDFAFDSASLSVARASADNPGQLRVDGRFDQQVVQLEGSFVAGAGGPDQGLKIDIQASYAGDALTAHAKGFIGEIPDLSGLSLEVSVSSATPVVLVQEFGEPEWVSTAREVKTVSVQAQLQGKGSDALSVRKGDIRFGMGDALDLSVSGSLADVLQGTGLAADVAMKSQSPSELLHRLGLDLPPIDTVSGEADLSGSLQAPVLKEIKARVALASGVVLNASGSFPIGSFDGDTSHLKGELDVSLRAKALEEVAKSLEDMPGETGERVKGAMRSTEQRAAVKHVLSLGPLDVSAQMKLSDGLWALADLKGLVGSDQGEWIRLSGSAKSVWPTQAGVQVRVDSRIENPPLGFAGREALLDHLDSVRVGATWNVQEGRTPSLDDLQIHVDATGDLTLSVIGRVELEGGVLSGATGTISVEADSLAEFNGLAGQSLPPWSPVKLEARFDGTAQEWKLDDVVLGLGRARLRGDGEWNGGASVPRFAVRLKVDELSLPRASRAFRQEAPDPSSEAAPSSPKSASIDWGWLSTTEADFDLSADRVVLGEGWVGEDLALKLGWREGVFQGPSLDMHWPNGGVQVRGRVDAQKSVPTVELGVAAQALDMQSIVGWMGQPRALSGKAELVLDLKTQGDTRASMIAGLDGTGLIHVDQGMVLDRYANALQVGFEGGSNPDDEQEMNCLVTVLESKKGVVETHALLWDTPIKLVRGLGVLNLNTDHLDLLLRPHLKRTIARSVTAAIRIEGPLDDLRVRPEPLQTVTDLARGLIGRTLRVVDRVTPQLGQAVLGLGSTTGHMVASTGLDIPSVMDFLAGPESCESVLASKEVKQLEAFRPAATISN